MKMHSKAYGSWPSQISSEQLVAQSLRITEPRFEGESIYWLESRPEEKGRSCVVRAKPGEPPSDLLPPPISARSKVNEYGGGCYCVYENTLFFVQADDQRIYRLDLASPNAVPVAISPDAKLQYGDLHFDRGRQRVIAVCENHTNPDQEPVASIVSLSAEGHDCFTLIEGDDFYSSPRVSPCGQFLCWLSWNHPAMPWTNNSCFAASLNEQGVIIDRIALAGEAANQPPQAIFQPQWSPKSELFLVSDLDNWWRLYKVINDDDAPPELKPVLHSPPTMAEFGMPHWVFGQSTWGFLDEDTLLATYTRNGTSHLCTIDIEQGDWQSVSTDWTDFSAICTDRGAAVVLAGSYCQASQLSYWHSDKTQGWITLKAPDSNLDASRLSQPQAISFGAPDGTAHGFYYPPFNGENRGLESELPPLIVLAHGGPTSQTTTALNIKVQYWCSRGFAVVDVNYRGSTGYGREYRLALDGQWGISDVEDVCQAAHYLVDHQLADPERLAIKGGSAGGYTVLAALTFTDTFKAGASLYGIGDLETLVQDTHKFESRYVDTLVGPYPEALDTYHQRSPIHHVEQLNCPVIFFQGDQDRVVPPNQAETMVAALTDKGLPVAYVKFIGEGHGFRQADNIVQAVENELYFYSKIFGFKPADQVADVSIINASAIHPRY